MISSRVPFDDIVNLYYLLWCFMLNMPLAWFHNLSREEAEKLASELSLSTQGTLDELRKRLKEKWKTLEGYLPPQSTDKSEVSTHAASVSDVKSQSCDLSSQVTYFQIKSRGKVATDLVKNIPVLSDTEPESVFKFLVRAREVYDLKLVTDAEFLALLVPKTVGRLTQIVSAHLSISSKWGSVCAEILSTFLPPRIREVFLSRYVLDRFQSATEELSQFVTSVVVAADILSYEVPESVLVHRMVQNIHPSVRSQLLFVSEPKSIRELFSLATEVAERRAIEDRRKFFEHRSPKPNSQSGGGELRPLSMAVDETPRDRNLAVTCWKCHGKGHLRRDCPSSNNLAVRNSGNARGARR
jgi:hypothetical protein